jgi:hypothetical protein
VEFPVGRLGHLALCDDGQQLTEGDDNLGASQRGTNAEAYPVAERQVPTGVAGDVEDLWVIAERLVTVGRADEQEGVISVTITA